jgi:hypothetical protein
LPAYITGSVDQERRLRNKYLVTENRIRRKEIIGRIHLSDGERQTLTEIGQKPGEQALKEMASLVKPDAILAWHSRLIAKKFDGSQQRPSPERPKIVGRSGVNATAGLPWLLEIMHPRGHLLHQ